MAKLINYSEALEIAGDKRHLLLGNGFSIAWKKDIFSYESLFEKANFSNVSIFVKELFKKINTNDFEKVIFALKKCSQVLSVYKPSAINLIRQLDKDADILKEILIKAITDNHPEYPKSITDREYEYCSTFLKNFSHIYTLNYDLLLYWVIMHSIKRNKYDDGFRTPTDEEGLDYVTWEVEKSSMQNIHYLHGALHIFDAGAEIQKYTWINTGIKLIDQIREAIEKDKYPLIVAEGTADEKKEKIQHSGYLNRGYRSLRSIQNSLFIYGWSFSDNDIHIINVLKKSHIKKYFISIHGDINSQSNKNIIKKCNEIFGKYDTTNVYYYSTDSTKIWR